MLLRNVSKHCCLFRSIVQRQVVVRPTVLLTSRHLHKHIPNLLSVSRLGCSFLVGYFIVEAKFYNALYTIAYCGISDALDGILARRWNCQSRFGQIVDPLADKCLAASLALSLTIIGQLPILLMALILTRDFLIMVGALYIWKRHGKQVELKPTNLSKINTFVLVVGLLLNVVNRIGWVDDNIALWANIGIAASTMVSGLHYLTVIRSFLRS